MPNVPPAPGSTTRSVCRCWLCRSTTREQEKAMDASPRKSIHPLVAIAAIAVIIFSAVGIGAITGVIPTSKSNQQSVSSITEQPVTPPAPAVQTPQPNTHQPVAAPAPKAQTSAPAPSRPVVQRPAAQPAPVEERA